ncbi:MAG: glutathione S-transferase C-terminal domain-containing protein [Corynebacterium sp.]|nr:glutathione S-transferase C-terminal domain-containing protein [Corynebacterium sp.]
MSTYGSAQNAAKSGAFKRDTRYINDRIRTSGSELHFQGDNPLDDTPDDTTVWPVTPHRYRLVGARACPWAHRAILTRRLMGLEDVISLGLAAPTHDVRSWTFDLDPDGLDPVLKIPRLQDAYFARFPDYPRGITVPAIVDETTGKVVTNNFHHIVPDLATQWGQYTRPGAPDLYPTEMRAEIDSWSTWLYKEINNGVYRCGFAGDQEAYNAAFERLWAALDRLEEHLGTHRYMVGEQITLADIYLYPTLVRFDPVYHGHFKCNRNRLTEMPNLWGYLRDLYQTPGFGDTTDFQEIKQHYYIVHHEINPTGIVPLGPDMHAIESPHHREHLGGSAFGAHGVAPGPVPLGEVVRNPL